MSEHGQVDIFKLFSPNNCPKPKYSQFIITGQNEYLHLKMFTFHDMISLAFF